MVRRSEPGPTDNDERLGEAIEVYLALAEQGHAPEPEDFAARYPDLQEDLAAALEGLSLVRGLVGAPGGSGQRLESGHRIAGYRIVRELGRGGMGVVYEAVHVGLDRPVALKVLGSHAAPDSTGRRRFLNEARTAAGLHHTHIVPVFDVGQVGGLCYYAMQRIEGCGLDCVLRHLRRDRASGAGSSTGGTPARSGRAPARHGSVPPLLNPPGTGLTGLGTETTSWHSRDELPALAAALGPLGPRERDDEPPFEPPRGSAYFRWVAAIGRQAAEALAYAHHRGIVHRDVKPSNLLVDARGVVWMADFGLARRLADPGLTHHDSLLGTPRYMSPEQARIGPIDGRTDVYSLGATLYELLTLRPPFEGKTAAELIEQIAGREPAALREHDPRIPRDLETIVLKALAKRPADRYATASDLAEDLGRFLKLEPVKARRIGPLGRLWRVARRHPGITAVSTAAALTVLAVATVAYVRIVHERNIAVQEKDQKEEALQKMEAANRLTQAALMNQFWSGAQVVRMSNVPNRRARGLDLLKDAAARGPDAALRARLRDEAIQFLVLRDVKARPALNTGRARGIVFDPEGTRLAAWSDDGEKFNLWDLESGQGLNEQRLRAEAGAVGAGSDPLPGTFGGRSGGRGRPGPGGPRGPGGPWIAASGQRLAVVLPEGKGLRLFDSATGAKLRDVKTPGLHVLAVHAAAEGQRFVTVEMTPNRTADGPSPVEYQVNLWDAEQIEHDAAPLATLERWQVDPRPTDPPRHTFPMVALGPDGKVVATARLHGKEIALWSGQDGTKLGLGFATQAELTALAVGPHGQLAAAGGGAIRLWDIESRSPLPSLSPHQNEVRLMEFSPNGTLLAGAGFGTEVELWDTAAGGLVAVLPTPDRVGDLAFAPDGRTLAAAGNAATTAVWAVIEPVARAELSGFESPTTALAFRDDALLALGSSNVPVRFWRPGRCLSGPQLLSAAGDDDDEATATENATAPRDRPLALTFDHEGRLIALEADALQFWAHPQTSSSSERVAIPDFRDRERERGRFHPSSPSPRQLPPFRSLQLARSADGRTLFVARQARVFVWRASEPDRMHLLQTPPQADSAIGGRGPAPGWRALAASPRGDRLYLTDMEGTVRAWSLDGDRVGREDWSWRGGATHLALSPDGQSLAVCDRSAAGVLLLDALRGGVRARLVAPEGESEGAPWSLAFAPGGHELAVGTQQGEVLLWLPNDPSRPRLRLPGHRGPVATLVYDPQGHYLATGGPDKIIDVWDMEKIREELGKLGLAW